MEFIGVKELSQNTSALINQKDWVVITKNGKPVKLMLDINEEDLEDFILAKKLKIEEELEDAMEDLRKGKLKTLKQMLGKRKKN